MTAQPNEQPFAEAECSLSMRSSLFNCVAEVILAASGTGNPMRTAQSATRLLCYREVAVVRLQSPKFFRNRVVLTSLGGIVC